MILNFVAHSFLIRSCASTKQCPNTESIVLGRDYFLPAHPVHAGQVLLIHDVLLYALPGTGFICGF